MQLSGHPPVVGQVSPRERSPSAVNSADLAWPPPRPTPAGVEPWTETLPHRQGHRPRDQEDAAFLGTLIHCAKLAWLKGAVVARSAEQHRSPDHKVVSSYRWNPKQDGVLRR